MPVSPTSNDLFYPFHILLLKPLATRCFDDETQRTLIQRIGARMCVHAFVCVCVGLIWDVSVCRCNNKVHGARQRLPSLPQQHLCCLERERAVEGGGRESNRLSESERVADRFVCSPANSLSSKPVQYKTRLGEKCSKLYRKKSIREGLEKHGNVLKASPGSAEYSLKINK